MIYRTITLPSLGASFILSNTHPPVRPSIHPPARPSIHRKHFMFLHQQSLRLKRFTTTTTINTPRSRRIGVKVTRASDGRTDSTHLSNTYLRSGDEFNLMKQTQRNAPKNFQPMRRKLQKAGRRSNDQIWSPETSDQLNHKHSIIQTSSRRDAQGRPRTKERIGERKKESTRKHERRKKQGWMRKNDRKTTNVLRRRN